ncbi:hypothetical protein IWZ00DRAFT_183900 [Phyllosticta capitalensis]|uniref:Uncharacterized protein n=1 Tax=Phyllosticta capitalensis TaxID=121624 RepID=A0ABR1YUI3_9PEZI
MSRSLVFRLPKVLLLIVVHWMLMQCILHHHDQNIHLFPSSPHPRIIAVPRQAPATSTPRPPVFLSYRTHHSQQPDPPSFPPPALPLAPACQTTAATSRHRVPYLDKTNNAYSLPAFSCCVDPCSLMCACTPNKLQLHCPPTPLKAACLSCNVLHPRGVCCLLAPG